MSDVRFMTRRVCSLCRDALPLVERIARRRGHSLEIIDVDDAGVAGVYGERVPVVVVDGVEVLEGRFTARQVRRALR